MIRVSPNEQNPTHHIVLSDGVQEVGLILCDSSGNADGTAIQSTPVPRTALKTTSGQSKYADLEPPWGAIVQDDWSGGQGKLDFDDDKTRYWDSDGLYTLTSNKISPGPENLYGLRPFSGIIDWHDLVHGTSPAKYQFYVAEASSATINVKFRIRAMGNPPGPATFAVSSSRSFGTHYPLEDYASIQITPSTRWVEIVAPFSSEGHYQVLAYPATGSYWSDGSDTGFNPYGHANTVIHNERWLASVNSITYIVVNDGSTTWFQVAGEPGVAAAASNRNTIVCTGKAWATNAYAGKTVRILNPNAVPTPNGTIRSNTADTLTLDVALPFYPGGMDFLIYTPNATPTIGSATENGPIYTVYAGQNYFYYSVPGAVYRVSFDNGWTLKRTLLLDHNATSISHAKHRLYGRLLYAATGTYGNISAIDEGDTFDMPNGRKFDRDISVQLPYIRSGEAIRNLIEYGESDENLWVLAEDALYTIQTGTAVKVPLKESAAVRNANNMAVALQHDVYLYFSYGDSIERLYQGVITDVGPSRDDGFGSKYGGVVTAATGYPGTLFVAYSSNGSTYPAIYAYNQRGWCRIWSDPTPGLRFSAMDIGPESIMAYAYNVKPVYGTGAPQLALDDGYFSQISLATQTLNRLTDTQSVFSPYGELITGWMYSDLKDVIKYYKSITLFADNVPDRGYIDAWYQVDNDTTWTYIGQMTQPTSQEIDIYRGTQTGVNGKRIRFKIAITSHYNKGNQPILRSLVVNHITRVPVKYSYAMTFRTDTQEFMLDGKKDSMSGLQKIQILDGWARNLTPLTLRSIDPIADSRVVFLEPSQLKPIANKTDDERYIGSLSCVEV